MASEKGLIVLATFFIVMSLTTNIGFAKDGAAIELYLATALNILATFVKVGMKRGVLGMTSLGASVVGDIHLIWAVLVYGTDTTLAAGLAFGAIFANVVSIALLLMESYMEAKKEYSEA
ncbi:MAG: hypothetical protein CVT88_08520 [Candidatus Altiarchaeales archaeon HGW-Altiarchaeales-1]|nr:MAG: hypothetical protein CVT88_08520 [Candidatus Altiarchaeales archaeon HGW-Altiarchaeales-1]